MNSNPNSTLTTREGSLSKMKKLALFKKEASGNKPPLSEADVLFDIQLQARNHAQRFNKKSVTVTRRVKLGYTKVEKTLSYTHGVK